MSKQSMLSVFVDVANRLRNTFNINGRPTDGTTDVIVSNLAATTNLALKPSDVELQSDLSVKGMSVYKVDGHSIDPTAFVTTHLCDLIILDSHDTRLSGLLVSQSTGAIYSISGNTVNNQWSMIHRVMNPTDLSAQKSTRGIATVITTQNPDDTLDECIVTTHANCPLPVGQWYINTTFLGTKVLNGDMYQTATRVSDDTEIYIRVRRTGAWTSTSQSMHGWVKVITAVALGTNALQNTIVSTAHPDDSLGADGDRWIKII